MKEKAHPVGQIEIDVAVGGHAIPAAKIQIIFRRLLFSQADLEKIADRAADQIAELLMEDLTTGEKKAN